jgi:hypothetical protein
MRGQTGIFDIDERLKELSAKIDDVERRNGIVDLKISRPDLFFRLSAPVEAD